MRRRTWSLLRMADVIFSHQVSLPSMINEHDCDTQLPGNFYDEEIHPDMDALPAPRPKTDQTPVAYMIVKAQLCYELGNILQLTNSVGKHVPYDEIIRFDAKIRQIMQELPPHLKLTPLEGCSDPVTVIIARFNVDILYQKIMCLLHRKYLPRARQNARYAHSRRSAIEASLQALDHLAVLHRHAGSNGRLRSVKWYVKSIATKDFILPAMLTILDLHYDNITARSMSAPDPEGGFLWPTEKRLKMIRALEEALEIWKALADTSMEAFKAAKITDIMLQKIRLPGEVDGQTMGSVPSSADNTSSSSTNMASMDPSPAVSNNSFSPSNMLDFSAGFNPLSPNTSGSFMNMDFGMMPGGASLATDPLGMGSVSSPLSMFPNMGATDSTAPDLPSTFDWVSFLPFLSFWCKSVTAELTTKPEYI